MSKRGDVSYVAPEFRAYKSVRKAGIGSSVDLILAFTHFGKGKQVSYNLLQMLVIKDTGAAARQTMSFDHRLQRLNKLGFIIDLVKKRRNQDGVIIPTRYYSLTKKGRSALLKLQKERNEEAFLRKKGVVIEKHRVGGDKHTNKDLEET